VTSWAHRIAVSVHAAFAGDVPAGVLERAAVHLLDTLACAAGAQDAPPVAVVRRAVASSAPPEATIFYTGRKASVADAVLVNGTAVRYLDANDIFLGAGPGGHPSDNIPVAINVAETTGSCGRDVLAAIAVGYDLVARLRRIVYRPSPRGPDWHEVSVSGVVSAAMTALLGGANVDQLADAVAIGAAKGYALKEIRRGQLSMLKASANALVARDGITAAKLAMNGMAGPSEVFEGESGLLRTFGAEPGRDDDRRAHGAAGVGDPPSVAQALSGSRHVAGRDRGGRAHRPRARSGAGRSGRADHDPAPRHPVLA
jgi:2-methylcitrate dehydratase